MPHSLRSRHADATARRPRRSRPAEGRTRSGRLDPGAEESATIPGGTGRTFARPDRRTDGRGALPKWERGPRVPMESPLAITRYTDMYQMSGEFKVKSDRAS